MAKALLVDIDLRVRVIVPEDAPIEMILDAATKRAKDVFKEEGDSFFYENVGEIKSDLEIPYNPETDEVFAYYHPSPKPIGYQIETADGTHEIPNEFHSFEIMSYQRAEQWMIDNPCAIKWMIVPIFEGEIEDPTFLD